VINLRANYAIRATDRAARDAYAARCERARAAQPYRYAVAPACKVTTHDGQLLCEGAEVKLSHFRTTPELRNSAGELTQEARPPWKQLEALVFNGVVLESYTVPSDPDAA
jgi:hypothetical protein